MCMVELMLIVVILGLISFRFGVIIWCRLWMGVCVQGVGLGVLGLLGCGDYFFVSWLKCLMILLILVFLGLKDVFDQLIMLLCCLWFGFVRVLRNVLQFGVLLMFLGGQVLLVFRSFGQVMFGLVLFICLMWMLWFQLLLKLQIYWSVLVLVFLSIFCSVVFFVGIGLLQNLFGLGMFQFVFLVLNLQRWVLVCSLLG